MTPLNREAIGALESIARNALDAAERYSPACERAIEAEYVSLRGKAASLNRRHEWTTIDEFDDLFPTLDAQAALAELERRIDVTGFRSEVEPGAPVERHLRHLAYWASAVALAGRSASEW